MKMAERWDPREQRERPTYDDVSVLNMKSHDFLVSLLKKVEIFKRYSILQNN
jgi:hypothetical protein